MKIDEAMQIPPSPLIDNPSALSGSYEKEELSAVSPKSPIIVEASNHITKNNGKQ